MKKINIILSFLLCFLLILTVNAYSESKEKKHDNATHAEKEGFQPGPFIMHHVMDAHEWHILTIGHTHISIPLPVILYTRGKLDIFMFSSLEGEEHGEKRYKNYIYKDGVFSIEGSNEKVYDFSITKDVVELFIAAILLLVVFISVARYYKQNPNMPPKGLASFLEPLILFVRDDIALSSIGPKKYERYLPYLLTLFFFIFFGNLLGLIPIFPGGANLTGNIAVTMVLAVLTFLITTFSANKSYWIHILNTPGVPWWLKFPLPLMPIVEIIGIFTKPFVLMVRLFANITAGHIIILGFMSLIFIFGEMNVFVGYGVSIVSVAFSLFMSLLELLVAFLQAYVFTLLSAIYFGMATEEHEHHHEEAEHAH